MSFSEKPSRGKLAVPANGALGHRGAVATPIAGHLQSLAR